MEPAQLLKAIRDENIPHERVAEALGKSRPVAWKLLDGRRALKADEIAPLTKLLHDWRREQKALKDVQRSIETFTRPAPAPQPDIPPDLPDENRYAEVAILPFFGGMGGGGVGEVLRSDDLDKALIPRILIEGYLHGRPEDFVVIRVRGDSMEPDFYHDDELLCDLRDKSPTQPGPFALFHEDGYLVKNIERMMDGQAVIFSSNQAKYPAREVSNHTTQIIGRPVWFGRRL